MNSTDNTINAGVNVGIDKSSLFTVAAVVLGLIAAFFIIRHIFNEVL